MRIGAMKRTAIIAGVLALGLVAAAHAETIVPLRATEATRKKAFIKTTHDHPLTTVAANRDVQIVVTTDAIMHSCCMPPWLVVSGKVTNVTAKPINYVKLVFSFRNASGKTVYTDDVYNLKAASMNDDEQVRRILNEKPHFVPLPPGASDKFTYQIPMPMLPRYAKVEVTPTVPAP
jgi:hypothetical protein